VPELARLDGGELHVSASRTSGRPLSFHYAEIATDNLGGWCREYRPPASGYNTDIGTCTSTCTQFDDTASCTTANETGVLLTGVGGVEPGTAIDLRIANQTQYVYATQNHFSDSECHVLGNESTTFECCSLDHDRGEPVTPNNVEPGTTIDLRIINQIRYVPFDATQNIFSGHSVSHVLENEPTTFECCSLDHGEPVKKYGVTLVVADLNNTEMSKNHMEHYASTITFIYLVLLAGLLAKRNRRASASNTKNRHHHLSLLVFLLSVVVATAIPAPSANDARGATQGDGFSPSQQLPLTLGVKHVSDYEERRHSLAQLIASVREDYATLPILVAYEGAYLYDMPGASGEQYLHCSAAGLSAGRNAIVAHVHTEFVMIVDDDVQFHARTQLQTLVAHLHRDPNLALVAACYHPSECYAHNFSSSGSHVRLDAVDLNAAARAPGEKC
jgi:hypothetical protein